jgi:hypothetical protein
MSSLYKDLVRAGIPTDHHESDLYVLDTSEAREAIKKYGYKFKTFTSNIDGKRWIDVPFAYEPFWEKKGRRHATMKVDDTSTGRPGRPSKETFQQAAKWIRRELNKRDDGGHPSHLAAKVLEEADEKFKLGSFGVEGWAKSPSTGYQYLNYGDPYDSTIVVRSNPTRATVIVALGGWASYAGNG